MCVRASVRVCFFTHKKITEKGLNFLSRAPKQILMPVDDFLYRSGDVLQARAGGWRLRVPASVVREVMWRVHARALQML